MSPEDIKRQIQAAYDLIEDEWGIVECVTCRGDGDPRPFLKRILDGEFNVVASEKVNTKLMGPCMDEIDAVRGLHEWLGNLADPKLPGNIEYQARQIGILWQHGKPQGFILSFRDDLNHSYSYQCKVPK